MGAPAGAKTQWQPTIPVDQSIYEEKSTQEAPLGTRLEVGDRVFYYAQLSTSANVSAGDVLAAPAIVASHGGAILTPTATSAGATTFTVTLGTAMATNEYAEGYVMIATGSSMGATYRVKSHPAAATAATCAITLYDTLKEAMTATCETHFVPNMYNDIKVGSEALNLPVGVAPVDVTTGNYFWCQTYGPSSPRNVSATTAANLLRMGTTGGVESFSVTGTTAGSTVAYATPLGKNYGLVATAGENAPVFLTIRP